MTSSSLNFTAVLLVCCNVAIAGGNAAPSSHMVYNDASFPGDILVNEVRVPKGGEAMYTYYEGLGWGGKAGGYAGIQAHPKGHNYIFSIWDHKSHAAPIRPVYRGAGTVTENFGGEGTGLKSWNFELGWETDVWYTLVSRCWPVGDHTYFGHWVHSSKTNDWTHLVTMDVATKGAMFQGGNDSFIEDWLETGKHSREMHLRNGWKRKANGGWHAFARSRYSVNSWDLVPGKRSFNYRTNWDGGVASDADGKFYFMTSGGEQTRPQVENPSTHSIERTKNIPDQTAIQIEQASVMRTDIKTATVRWTNRKSTLPQFSVLIEAWDNADRHGEPVIRQQQVQPSIRSIEIPIPAKLREKPLHWSIRCTDIFGNTTAKFAIGQ